MGVMAQVIAERSERAEPKKASGSFVESQIANPGPRIEHVELFWVVLSPCPETRSSTRSRLARLQNTGTTCGSAASPESKQSGPQETLCAASGLVCCNRGLGCIFMEWLAFASFLHFPWHVGRDALVPENPRKEGRSELKHDEARQVR